MQFETYADREMLAMIVAGRLAGALTNQLMVNESASFVVPGGTTPGPIFDALCAANIEWNRVHVMLSDERWVSEDSDRSNTRLLRERLLVNNADEAVFVPYYADGVSPDIAAPDLSTKVEPLLPVSVLLLGMGVDMHTASLFPGAPGLAAALASDAPAMVPVHVEGQEPRISLSGPVLAGAMSKHLIIFGDEKRAALERAQSMSDDEAPIRVVFDGLTVHWAE